MSEHEKKIVKAFAEALPGMSDFDKGYVLGMSEQIAAKRLANQQKLLNPQRMEKCRIKTISNSIFSKIGEEKEGERYEISF